MPLFKRREQPDGPQPPRDEPPRASRILHETEIREHLDEEGWRAGRYDRPLAVLCVVPQLLPDESLQAGELQTAAEVLRGRLRLTDRVGSLNGAVLVAVLPETDGVEARAVGHRLASDLAIGPTGPSPRKWAVGVAECPADGQDEATLIQSATSAARR